MSFFFAHWNTTSPSPPPPGAFVQSFPGHRDAVTALAFREGTHQLFSGSYDRTVKMWSLDDRAYMDSLFGHQVGDIISGSRYFSKG